MELVCITSLLEAEIDIFGLEDPIHRLVPDE